MHFELTLSEYMWISELYFVSLPQGRFSEYASLVRVKRPNTQFTCVFVPKARHYNATLI